MFGAAEEAVVTALLDGTADAPPVKILRCNDTNCYDVGEQTLSVTASAALRPRIEAMLRSMSAKNRSATPLEEAEKPLLDRQSVVAGQHVSVRVNLGEGRKIKKNT